MDLNKVINRELYHFIDELADTNYEDELTNFVDPNDIKDGGYGGNAYLYSGNDRLDGDDLDESLNDYRNAPENTVSKAVKFIETIDPDKFELIDDFAEKGMSSLHKTYMLLAQNIKKAIGLADDAGYFYNKLMSLQNYLKKGGQIKEDLSYWHVSDASPESDSYQIVGEEIRYMNPLSKEVSIKLLTYFLEKQKGKKFTNVTFLGEGTFGYAYLMDGIVYKLTRDHSEYNESKELVGKKNNYLANIYEVYKFTYKGEIFYLISQEYLQTDPQRFENLFDMGRDLIEKNISPNENYMDVINSYTSDKYHYNIVYKDIIEEVLSEDKKVLAFFKNILAIADEARANGITSKDFINPNNLGYKPNGYVGFFDMGFGNSYFDDNEPGNQIDEDGSTKFWNKNGPVNPGDVDMELQENEDKDEKKSEDAGCLMVFFDVPIWDKIVSKILPKDIYRPDEKEFGLETEPHATVLFGFNEEVTPEEVQEKLMGVDLPISITIKGISLFNNPEYDVLKFDLESPQLEEMREMVMDLPNTLTYTDYNPHMTIAYLLRGKGQKYVHQFKQPITIKSSTVVFSDKNRKKVELEVGPDIRMISENGRYGAKRSWIASKMKDCLENPFNPDDPHNPKRTVGQVAGLSENVTDPDFEKLTLDEDSNDLWFEIKTEYQDEINDFAKKIAQKLGFNQANYMGEGAMGFAYDVGKNTILKITSDKSEAVESQKLLGQKNKHLGDVYGVYKLDDIDSGYIILREKLIVNPQKVRDLKNKSFEEYQDISQHNGDVLIHGWNLDVILMHGDMRDVKQSISLINKYGGSEKYPILTQFVGILHDMFNNDIASPDFHDKNFGFKKDGSLAYYDIGSSRNNIELEQFKNLRYESISETINNEITKFKKMNESQNIMTLQELPFKDEIEGLGGEIYAVGGFVRDALLGKESNDLDVLITKIPADDLEKILSKYGKVDNIGVNFPVLLYHPPDGREPIEIALPRTEKSTGDGYRDSEVTVDPNLPIEKDMLRRDFTINAMLQDMDGNVIDPYGGKEDLKNKVIKQVDPKAFGDDPVRMLRAIRFASRFGFTIEPETLKSIKKNAYKIKNVEGMAERVRKELYEKIYEKNADMYLAATMLRDTGLYKEIFGREPKEFMHEETWHRIQTFGDFMYLLLSPISDKPEEIYRRVLKGDSKTVDEIEALGIGFNNVSSIPSKNRIVAYNINQKSKTIFENTNILPAKVLFAINELKSDRYPRDLSELKVKGGDMMNLGLQGKAIGDRLKWLIMSVYGGGVRNEREDLLNYIKSNMDNTNRWIGEAYELIENILNEREIRYMPNAETVEVNQNCRLGGKGDGTSDACNQGEMKNLTTKKIEEDEEEVNSKRPYYLRGKEPVRVNENVNEEVRPYDDEMDDDEDINMDSYEIYNEAIRIANDNNIRILRNKNLIAYTIEDDKVVAALFESVDGDEYSFDVVVDKNYQSRGLGKELVKTAIDNFDYYKDVYDNKNLKMNVDVVNPHMRNLLKKYFKFVDKQEVGPDRYMMTRGDVDEVIDENTNKINISQKLGYYRGLWKNIGDNKKNSYIRGLYDKAQNTGELSQREYNELDYFLKNGESQYKGGQLSKKH